MALDVLVVFRKAPWRPEVLVHNDRHLFARKSQVGLHFLLWPLFSSCRALPQHADGVRHALVDA